MTNTVTNAGGSITTTLPSDAVAEHNAIILIPVVILIGALVAFIIWKVSKKNNSN
jgi:hypothetical protein